jgi:hypothetical protein
MANYVQMAGEGNCASCADLFPPEGGAGPAPDTSVVLPGGDVTVGVTVEGGEARCSPWWIWLAIGVGLGYVAND